MDQATGAPLARVPPGLPFVAVLVHDETRMTVALRGELDLATAEGAKAALFMGETAAGKRQLVADLRELTFCGSVGLSLLLEAAERARVAGRRFAVLPGPVVRHVFQLVAVGDQVEIMEDAGRPRGPPP